MLREAQREAHRNSQINDIRDEEMDSAQLMGDKYRGIQGRDDSWRVHEMRDNQLGTNNNNNNRRRNKVRMQRRLFR